MTVSAKKRAAQRARRSEKREEHRQHSLSTHELRNAVFARAGGRCEAVLAADMTLNADGTVVHRDQIRRCTRTAVHMDHFFGKARFPETLSNCWALCIDCDESKTRGGNAGLWHRSFIAHAAIHCYQFEKGEALKRLQGIIRARAESAVSLPAHLHRERDAGDHHRGD